MSVFGSNKVFVDIGEEEETIFKDEIDDGIASCAQEQAEAWVAAAKEEQVESSNAAFAKEILQLAGSLKGDKGSRAGGIGCSTRLQPRFQKGALHFDAIAREQEAKRAAAAAVAKEKMEDLRRTYSANADQGLMPYRELAMGGATLDGDGLVVQLGSLNSCAGVGGEDTPRSVFPSIVGRPRHMGVMVGMGQKDSYCGDEAQCKRGILTLKYPVHKQRVANWDDAEKLLHHIFYNELRVAPEDHRVLVSAPANAPRCDIEKYCQILMETFCVHACQILPSATLAVLASGRQTALSVDIGHASTTVVPVINGAPLEDALFSVPVGGSHVTDYLMKISTERGYSFTTTSERDIVRNIKEKLCFVSTNFDNDMITAARSSTLEKPYELPDGQVITIGNERFRAPELLFQPAFAGVEAYGLVDAVYWALMRVHPQFRSELACNICLSGGSSMFPGLIERLTKDLTTALPATVTPKIIAAPERKYASWIGGSILSELLPASAWCSQDYYYENGPSAVDSTLYRPFAATDAVDATGDGAIDAHASDSPPAPDALATKPTASPEAAADAELEEKTRSDADVVCTQPPATTNCAVLPVGEMVATCPPVATGDALTCDGCTAVAADQQCIEGSAWRCTFCGQLNTADDDDLYSLPKSPIDTMFLLERSCMEPEVAAACPMVVFCIDVSGSMGTKVPGSVYSRLECMQRAVCEQIRQLHKNDPACRVALVTFGSDVEFYQVSPRYSSVKRLNGGRHTLQKLLEEGAKVSNKVQRVSSTCEQLLEAVGSLRCLDCTALGPALAFSVGVTQSVPGCRVILCTDGVANVGIGSLNSGGSSSFYTSIGNTAKARGVQVSVITTEGVQSGLEALGKTADISGGSVEVANPQELSSTLASMLNAKTLATEVLATVILPPQLTFAGEIHRHRETDLGTVTDHSVLSFSYEPAAGLKKALRAFYDSEEPVDDADKPFAEGLPIQLQLRFTSSDGDRLLHVRTYRLAATVERIRAEQGANTEATALHAIHASAGLAQRGDYSSARVNLISVQRLLQRCMVSRQNQLDYLAFIVQAEKLDQFMREAQAQAKLVGPDVAGAHDDNWERDDEASKAMYQMKSVSLHTFRAR